MAIDLILIPTYQRVEVQLTWNCIPPEYQQITKLIVHPEEAGRHRVRRRKYFTTELQGTGHAAMREYVYKQFPGKKVLYMEDDYFNFQRYDEGQGVFRNFTKHDWDVFISTMDNALEHYQRVGVIPYLNEVPEHNDLVYEGDNRLCGGLNGINLRTIPRTIIDAIDFHFTEVYEDTHLHMELLKHGVTNTCFSEFRYSTNLGSPGGLTQWREANRSKRTSPDPCYKQLEQKHSPFITLNERGTFKSFDFAGAFNYYNR